MSFNFEIEKAVQLVAYLVKLRGPDEIMDQVTLLKMLYIADRESLRETGSPITGDVPYSMRWGPVLSSIYDLTKPDRTPRDNEAIWDTHLGTEGYRIILKADPGVDMLSPFETDLLLKVFDKYKDFGTWSLSKLTHEFPEWQQSQAWQSIPLRVIVEALDLSDHLDEILQIQAEDTHFAELFKE